MSEDVKHIDIAEFRRLGYLQELNRRFLHPLGMALEIKVNDDGTEELAGVWDYRDDAEGIIFGEPFPEDFYEKADYVAHKWATKEKARRAAHGYMVQPA